MEYAVSAVFLAACVAGDDPPEHSTTVDTPPVEVPPLARRFVRDASARGAVCNNGSEAAYYHRAGTVDTWVVFLPGGGEGGCGTPEECDARWALAPETMATRWTDADGDHEIAPDRVEGGILSGNPLTNPHLHDAHHVYVANCSNDAWWGRAEASAATGGWHFRGASIVEAVFADLASDLGLAEGHTVVFVGSNAGADGVRFHLDGLPERLPGTTVHGVLDARFFPENRPIGWDPYRKGGEVDWVRGMYALYGVSPSKECFADHGADADACYLLHAHYAYVDAATFLVVPQRDGTLLAGQWGAEDPDDMTDPIVLEYQESTIASAEALPETHGLFIPDTTWHRNNVLQSRFTDHPISDPDTGLPVTLADGLEAWMSGAVVRLIEAP